MTGEELYNHYRTACMQVSNCGTDSWEELDDNSQAEWNRTAEFVNEERKTS